LNNFFIEKFNKIKTSKVRTFQNRTKSAQISDPQVPRYSAKVSQNEVEEGMLEISITWFVYNQAVTSRLQIQNQPLLFAPI